MNGREQLLTRVKSGVECVGHMCGILVKYRLEWPSLGVDMSTLQTVLEGCIPHHGNVL